MMKNLFLGLFLLTAVTLGAAPQLTPFRDGERVAFFGDSITQIGLYVNYLYAYWNMRHPELRTEFINCGVNGNNVSLALARYDRDLMKEKPDRVFLMFGMNDAAQSLYPPTAAPTAQQLQHRRAALERYRKELTRLVEKLLADRKEVVIMLPTPYDEYGTVQKVPARKDLNEKGLAGCAAIARKIAEEKNLSVVDFYTPMTALHKAHPDILICGDRIHSWCGGHLVMTALFLEAMGETPELADAAVDGKTLQTRVKLGSVTEVRRQKEGLSFLYAPQHLPLYLNAECRRIDGKFYPLTDKLNCETLKITNLDAGKYELKADGKTLGSFSAAELEKGINLSCFDTPCMMQSRELDKLLWQRFNLVRSLRFLREHERIAAEAGCDPQDPAAAAAAIDRWAAEPVKNQASRQKTAEKYKSLKKEESSLRLQLQKQTELFREKVQPHPYRIEIFKCAVPHLGK